MGRVFCVLCLISILAGRSIGILTVSNRSNHDAFPQFGLFDTPYANLPTDGIEGYLYYSKIQCNSTFPQPSSYNSSSYLLVDNYDFCILQRIALAKQAGYDCLLTYTVDDSVSKISNAIFSTGFPVAIIKSDLAQKIKDSLNDTSTDYMLNISGEITFGIIIISISFLTIFCITNVVIIFYSLCCRRHDTNEHVLWLETQAQTRREELVESILRQLQAMENGMGGGQTPLGQEQARALPETAYHQVTPGEEGKETCSICVDEFVNGVSIKTLPCNHIFHSECINEWLGSYSSLCPLCKIDVSPRLHTSRQRSHSINSSDDRLLSFQGSNYGSTN